MKNKHYLGIFSIVTAVALYGLFGVYSRLISPTFSTFSQSYIREIITLLVLTFSFIVLKIKWQKISKGDYIWFAGWLIPSAVTLLLLFVAFNALPLGTAYFLFYSTMIITGFLLGGGIV